MPENAITVVGVVVMVVSDNAGVVSGQIGVVSINSDSLFSAVHWRFSDSSIIEYPRTCSSFLILFSNMIMNYGHKLIQTVLRHIKKNNINIFIILINIK